jgi:hypothetical protein
MLRQISYILVLAFLFAANFVQGNIGRAGCLLVCVIGPQTKSMSPWFRRPSIINDELIVHGRLATIMLNVYFILL